MPLVRNDLIQHVASLGISLACPVFTEQEVHKSEDGDQGPSRQLLDCKYFGEEASRARPTHSHPNRLGHGDDMAAASLQRGSQEGYQALRGRRRSLL